MGYKVEKDGVPGGYGQGTRWGTLTVKVGQVGPRERCQPHNSSIASGVGEDIGDTDGGGGKVGP